MIKKGSWVMPADLHRFEAKGQGFIARIDDLHNGRVLRVASMFNNGTEVILENKKGPWSYDKSLFREATEQEMHEVRGLNLAEQLGISE